MEIINNDDIILLVKKEIDKDGDSCTSVRLTGDLKDVLYALEGSLSSIFECFNEVQNKHNRQQCYVAAFKIFQETMLKYSDE